MDVAAWLEGLGLGRYAQAFRDNDIDAEVLPRLTAEDLAGLGVASIGHRRKLIDAIGHPEKPQFGPMLPVVDQRFSSAPGRFFEVSDRRPARQGHGGGTGCPSGAISALEDAIKMMKADFVEKFSAYCKGEEGATSDTIKRARMRDLAKLLSILTSHEQTIDTETSSQGTYKAYAQEWFKIMYEKEKSLLHGFKKKELLYLTLIPLFVHKIVAITICIINYLKRRFQ